MTDGEIGRRDEAWMDGRDVNFRVKLTPINLDNPHSNQIAMKDSTFYSEKVLTFLKGSTLY